MEIKLRTENVNFYYGRRRAIGDLDIAIESRAITAIIGPSGCGKSTMLRLFNRMNDLIPGARQTGNIYLDGEPVTGKDVDVVTLRKKVGMVFQKPNVFPMTVYDNIVVGPKSHGIKKKKRLDEIVWRCLTQVAMWDELKDELDRQGQDLSAGQQQRLCIARSLSVEPQVILMDESCSALDPESTMKIEELMQNLACDYTIVIVSHNMEQALRVSDYSAFLMIDDEKVGRLVEFAPTSDLFSNPRDKRTEDYITGRFG